VKDNTHKHTQQIQVQTRYVCSRPKSPGLVSVSSHTATAAQSE